MTFELTDYSQSFISLLPPLIAIVLAIITHRVLISLGIAIVIGALALTGFHPTETAIYLFETFLHLFWDNGLNIWNIALISFLLLLGILTAFITRMGGTRAFGEWALTHIHSARMARLFTVFLGMMIFIDDYFNSLAVGQVARPVTDQYKVSRAKLAYLIDSTAAPVCLISPFSSWGAYVMGILALIFTSHHIVDYTPLSAFVTIIKYNFYPFISLLFVLTIAYTGWGIGPMKTHVMKAKLGQLFSISKGPVPGQISTIPVDEHGHIYDLIIPIVLLIASAVGFIVILGMVGAQMAAQPLTVLNILEHTDVAIALVMAAGLALLSCIVLGIRDKLTSKDYGMIIRVGAKAMSPAIYILLFAWMMIAIINAMGTGEYLSLLIDASLPEAFLPALLFILAGIMAFATGSSWGTFGIMMPIAANVAVVVEPSLMMPMLAAVLSGALFGDHCSPISDTSILSSTGAGCHLMDHVITQMPYCIIKAIIVLFAFVVYGFTRSWLLSAGVLLVGYFITLLFFHKHAEV